MNLYISIAVLTISLLGLMPTAGLSADATTIYEKQLARTKRQYRLGEISSRTVWQRLSTLYAQVRKGNIRSNPSELLQSQAYLIQEAGYPLLSAKYAIWALTAAKNPYTPELVPSWELLDKIAEKRNIHDLLIKLAGDIIPGKSLPPKFKNNWNYFVGESLFANGKFDEAIKAFEKLQIKDRYYLAGRYQLAMTYLFHKEDSNKAGLILKSMVSPDIRPVLSVKEADRKRYADYAHLALGRIQYERQKFPSAVKYFRKVQRNGSIYYNALFEQSWAFFLAGYPNHALGGLHAAESPFFPGRFNPEASVLRSIVYYWMCRYSDAKTALADFIENYNEPVTKLEQWLNQRSLTPEKSYGLFENLISGVSSQSLGISRDLLLSVSKTDPMVFARERLATVAQEQRRLKRLGIFRTQQNTAVARKLLNQWVSDLQEDLGKTYIEELISLRDDYRNFRSQANFIYIELLMSEKEQALGRELHAEAKLDTVSQSKSAKGWGRGDVPWKASDKGEYWWDEVGFYVYQVQPLCKVDETAE